MVRLGGFAKCISEPLGIVVRMSTEQIVKSFHMLPSRASLPDSHEFTAVPTACRRRRDWAKALNRLRRRRRCPEVIVQNIADLCQSNEQTSGTAPWNQPNSKNRHRSIGGVHGIHNGPNIAEILRMLIVALAFLLSPPAICVGDEVIIDHQATARQYLMHLPSSGENSIHPS